MKMNKRTLEKYKYSDFHRKGSSKKQKIGIPYSKGPSGDRRGGDIDLSFPHICLWCEEEFGVLEDVENHYEESQKCRPYVCHCCRRSFASVEALRSHRDFHPGFPITSLACVVCDQQFMATGDYQAKNLPDAPYNRIISESDRGRCFCTPCRRTKIKKEGRRSSIYSVRVVNPAPQKPLNRLNCPFCDSKFINLPALMDHCSGHKAYFLHDYPCDACASSFSSFKSLEEHLSTHDEGKIYLCDVCGVKMKDKNMRDSHREDHIHSSELGDLLDVKKNSNYAANKSAPPRPSSEYFADKINTVLKQRSIIMCEKCNFATKDTASLEEHKKTHHSQSLSWSQSGNLKILGSNSEKTQVPGNFTGTQKRPASGNQPYAKPEKLATNSRPSAIPEKLATNSRPSAIPEKLATNNRPSASLASPTKPPARTMALNAQTTKKFQCPFCQKSNPDLFSLTDHCRMHPNYIFYKITCQTCGMECSTVKDLSLHMCKHEKRCVFMCPVCGVKFYGSGVWNFHINTHIQANDFDKFLSRYKNPHFKDGAPAGFYKCHLCDDPHKTQAALTEHLKQQHEFSCQFCNKAYQEPQGLVSHLLTHEQHMFHNFKCTECPKDFESFFELERHIGVHQKRKTIFLCGICGATFPVEDERRHHLETHRGETISDAFVRVRDSEVPKEDGSRIFCRVCGTLYSQKKEYAIHVLNKHSLPFLCQYCTEAFPTSTALSAHCHQHDEYPLRGFRCSLCRNRFMSLVTLEDHISTAHEGSLVFLCCLCGEKFYDKDLRLKHELSHKTYDEEGEGKNFFTCSQCALRYYCKESLENHVALRHPAATTGTWRVRKVKKKAPEPYKPKIALPLVDKIPPPPTAETLTRFHCSFCSKTFGSKEGKEYHEKSHKTPKNPYSRACN